MSSRDFGEELEWSEVPYTVSYTQAVKANAEAFFKSLELLMEEAESEDSTQMTEALLDVISRRGLSQIAQIAWESVQPVGDIYVPADPTTVRHYLITVYSVPRIRITEIGS